VRANPTAAFALWNLGWRFVQIHVVEWRAAASVATTFEKVPVHVDHVSRTRLLVKVGHVLGAEEKTILQSVFKFGEGEVRGIRLGFRSHTPPHGIELPHELGITMPSFGRSDVLDPVVPPESAHATEGRNAAFRAYACPGENEDAIGGGKCEHG
jgi:hypothetical protein